MRGKIIGLLVVAVAVGAPFFLKKDTLQAQSSDKHVANEDTRPVNSSINSNSQIAGVENDPIIDFEGINGAQLFNIFKGANASEIVELLDEFNDDSTRVVVTSDGEILTGQINLKNVDTDEIKIDTSTDSDGITIRDLKVLIENNKNEINDLAD